MRKNGEWKESDEEKWRVEGKCRGQMESRRKVMRKNGKEEEVQREKDN
jgi:hypothetical protein